MFPNIRLMIVTVLAAILGIGCGLGLFATFRVNHEPLALGRLSNGGVPLQLAWEKAEPAPKPKPSPWGVGYPVNGEAKSIAAPVLPAQPAPADMHATEPALAAAATAASDRTSGETAVPIASKAESKPEGAVVAAADSPDPPVPAAEPRPAADAATAANTAPTAEAALAAETDRATEAASNPAEIAPDAETTPTAEAASTAQTAPVPEAAPAAETAPIDATAPAAQITPAAEARPASETAAPAAETAPASETADPETASAASPAAGAAPTADTASAAESAPAAQNGPAAEAAPAMEAPQGASAAPASGEEGEPVQNETTAALNSQTPATQKPAAQGASANSAGDRKAATKDVKRRVVKQQEVKTARPAPPVLRRVTKVLGWHRPQTAIASQSTGLFSQLVSEPAYQWTDTAAQPPQTVRRVVIRQRRVILKKPASQPSRQSSRTNQGSVATERSDPRPGIDETFR
jgi:hypothetical protein